MSERAQTQSEPRAGESAPIFISRAGSDAALAEAVGRILEEAGYRVVLQQWNFANRSFIAQMQAALEAGSRVVALLSPEYLQSDYCAAEWQSVLADDPLNKKGRLVVLRVGECAPSGLLKALMYWDLVSVKEPAAVKRIVLDAVREDRVREAAGGAQVARPARVPRNLPSGNVTFLFGDVEGGSALWEQHSAAMQRALRRLHEIVVQAIDARGGFVFKTVGDAFCAAFANTRDALRAARDALLVLEETDFSEVDGMRVRLAIHAGTAEERDGDFLGPPVNRVARLLAIGHGGQVLLSEVAALALRDELDSDLELRDLGAHALKDLAAPERVFQLVAPGLPPAFPPLRSLSVLNHNLPLQLTDFVGRTGIVAALKAQIERARLVTLLGAGGMGKTRTALQVAAELVDGSGDGVWFVDFAPLGSGEYVVAEIASVLGIREARGTPLLGSVVEFLKTKRLLLIFDNCEHVTAEARRAAEAIVKTCTEVRILATSREALGVGGEAVFRLPSLAVPESGEQLSAVDALRYEAVALFTTRATTADSRFALTDRNAPIVAGICRRLDGIALAIELAAARVKILSVTQLAQKLNERFRLLTSTTKSALPRQQTMRALIDWSYDLLAPQERQLFRRLAIFAGGWTLEAATAVCGDADADEFSILDTLTSLADKSLVVVDFGEEAQRFRLLESMRAYALDLVRSAGEYEALARSRAAYFAGFAGDGSLATSAAAEAVHLAGIECELENLREVLAWALEERHDVALGGQIAFALGRFWSNQRPREGQRWLELAYAELASGEDRTLAARLAYAMAAMLPHGSFERFEAAERTLKECRSAGDDTMLCRALSAYAEQLAPLGRADEAERAFEESLELARATGNERSTAIALAGLGNLAVDRNDIATARVICTQAVASFEAIGATDGVAYVNISLGQAEFRAGNLENALTHTRRARVAYGEIKDIRSTAWVDCDLAALCLAADDVESARTHARDAIALLRSDRHPLFLTDALESLSLVATLGGNAERGALLLAYAENAYRKLAHSRGFAQRSCHERHVGILTELLGAEELERRLAQGAALDEERAIEEALAV